MTTETSPAADADTTPDNYFDDATAPAPAAPEATETPAEKARRKRTTWPIRIFRCEGGGMFPVKDSPEFNELRDATDWINSNGKPSEAYMPVRHPEKALRQTLRLEEVAPW